MDDTVDSKVADLDRRVQALEAKVAAWTEPKASDSPAPQPTQAPAETLAVAQTTWAVFAMLGELKLLVWMLFDRRYHMGWLTRFIVIGLLAAILTSHWWAPFAVYDNFLSHLWDKLIDLVLGMMLFLVLMYETRRYKEWCSGG